MLAVVKHQQKPPTCHRIEEGSLHICPGLFS
jgi:hypothetical protein